MAWLSKWRFRFRSLVDRSRVERDLDDELRDYVEREVEREMAAGWSPEEVRRHVLAGLGGLEPLKEECRDARGVRWVEETLSDLRFAYRSLLKAPVFTATVVAALALCIGFNAAIIAVVDAVLFRPLPFQDQGRLVSITEGVPIMGYPVLPFPVLITCLSQPGTGPSSRSALTAVEAMKCPPRGSPSVCRGYESQPRSSRCWECHLS